MMNFEPLQSVLCDPARLEALAGSGLIAGQPSRGDAALDRLALLTQKVMRVPLALVSLVEKERQVFEGLSGGLPAPFTGQRETPLTHSFCQHVVTTGKLFVVENAVEDPRVAGNLAVRDLQVRAYLGVPLVTPAGHVLGSLCAIDVVARKWTEDEVETLTNLAPFATTELELRRTGKKMAEAVGHDRERKVEGADGTQLLVHDLRTPLNSLMLGLQTIPLLGTLNEEQQEALDLAARGGHALMSLVNDMLDLSAAEAAGGELDLDLSLLAPAEVLQTAMRQVDNLARQGGIELKADPLPAAAQEATFEGDSDKIVRALVNLLGNAIKFTPAQGSVRASVQTDAASGEVTFAVRDTGRGIAPDDHERIFDRFVRVGRTADGHGGRSSGLGLAFCKMVAEAHGGAITVASELERGSEFCLRVPARRG